MKEKKLSYLVPQYKEDDTIVKPLLDSIALQQCIDFDEIEVVIANDGTDVKLSEELLNSYPYDIKYIQAEHGGISHARNVALDNASGEYVAFIDDDDLLFNAFGIYYIFHEIEQGEFDIMNSPFVEETRVKSSGDKPRFVTHKTDDLIFIHGRIFRREWLNRNGFRFNEKVKFHEDAYFVALTRLNCFNQRDTKIPFHLWKYRGDSTSHNDDFVFKTYDIFIDCRDELIKEFIKRGMKLQAHFFAVMMVADMYYAQFTPVWNRGENAELSRRNRSRFKEFMKGNGLLYRELPADARGEVFAKARERAIRDGMGVETETFDSFIQRMME